MSFNRGPVRENGLANLPPGHQRCTRAKETLKIPHLGDTRTRTRLYLAIVSASVRE
jgi:hypothetical protein